MMEKLGIEKKELTAELQAEYSRKKILQHDLQKTASAEDAHRRAMIANEINEIKYRLDELQKR
jgi:hypothetical protein